MHSVLWLTDGEATETLVQGIVLMQVTGGNNDVLLVCYTLLVTLNSRDCVMLSKAACIVCLLCAKQNY